MNDVYASVLKDAARMLGQAAYRLKDMTSNRLPGYANISRMAEVRSLVEAAKARLPSTGDFHVVHDL